ncbi:MAG: P-loop ATPase, Sll1717 family [Candidatus Helarchaeota archaeon]
MYNFGPEAAQNDTELLSYFHTTKQVRTLINPNISTQEKNCIFSARPGGGKTALVKWLESGRHKRRFLVLPTSRTRMVVDDKKPNIEDYRNLISAELFTWVISEINTRYKLSEDLKNDCNKFYQWLWVDSVKKFFSEKFEGLSILGYGFSLKAAERNEYLKEIREKNKVGNASDLLKRIADEVKPMIAIEDPELIVGEGLQEDVTRDNAIRIGAFLSVLANLHCLEFQVVVFVKEHILQGVQKYYGDFSHFEGLIDALRWSENDLIEMLKLRVTNRLNLHWNTVFSVSQKYFKMEILPFMINGPRDLIFVCNRAGKEDQRISEANLENSLNSLRATKWSQIANQYNSLWPGINILASTVCDLVSLTHKDKPISRDEFKSILKKDFSKPGTALHGLRSHNNWMSTMLWATPSIEERLFYIGCLSYVKSGKKEYSWAGRSINEFNRAEKIFVNPLFV